MNPARGSRCSGVAGPVHGFTLIEMAVVLAIVGFILGGLLVPLRTQFDAARYDTVRAQLRTAEEALIGYAVANGGRLPCPDTGSDGRPDPAGGHAGTGAGCTADEGFLPHATLGLRPLDPWGNRLRYRADRAFTQTGGIPSPPDTASNIPATWGAWATPPTGITVADRVTTDEFVLIIDGDAAKDPVIEADPADYSLTGSNPGGPALVVFSCGKNRSADGANNGDGSAAAAILCGAPTAPLDDLYTQGVFTDNTFDDALSWVPRYRVVGRLTRAGVWPP